LFSESQEIDFSRGKKAEFPEAVISDTPVEWIEPVFCLRNMPENGTLS
jgi:hypothetical protein